MKICVTGITGFIGSVVGHKILDEGYSVVGTYRTCNKEINMPELSLFETGDINGTTDWTSALEGADAVVHTIARAHFVNDANSDSLEAYSRVNLHGSVNLARQAAASGVKRFIFLSSVKVNGDISPVTYTEFDKPSPEDSYGISKMEAERALRQIANQTGMTVTILRPPLVYGPNVKANFLRLIQIVDRGIPLPLASIKNQRSLIYVENLADAIVRCIRHADTSFKTYLVSDGVDISTPDLIRMIASSLGKSARLFRAPPKILNGISRLIGKDTEMQRLIGSLYIDDTKIRQELNWVPPYTIEYGFKKTIEWYKSVYKSNS